MLIFFDIETISIFSKVERDLNEKLLLSEEFFSWFSDLKEKYGEKLSFMPEYNKILCISCWYIQATWEIKTTSLSWDEKDIINKFFAFIEWKQISWFNIKGFDIPFIIKRALFHKIKVPAGLKFSWRKPRELEHIIDLQEIYKNWAFNSYSSLDLVCKFLWITSPKDEWINWSQVQLFYDNWKETEIIKYCERDVRATIDVYNYFKELNLI